MKAVKKIEISVLHKRITPIVYAVQGDTGREIECTVDDWDIPAGVEARAWVIKPSKKVVYNNCRIVDKAVFVPMTNQTLAEPGGAICMIEFVSGEDVVSSFSFNLYVYESASGDGIPSENESTVLEKMFEELAQDAIKTLNEAKAQAAAAKKSAQDTEKIKNDFTLTAQQAVADVNNAGQAQTQRVNTAGDTQVSRIQAEGTTQVQNVQATAAEIAADREQIHTNRDNTARLQRTTAGAITRSAEGSFITVTDAADEMGYKRIEIPGETRQRITTGAQLFDVSTIIENVVTPNFMPIQLKPNTEYTLSSDTAKDYDGPGAYLFIASGNHTSGSFTTANDGVWKGNPRTVTSDANGYVTIIYKQKVNGYLKNANIMLNSGSTALPWEPYTGSKPSPSPEYPQDLRNLGVQREDGKYKVKVTACKNNLLDMTGAKGGTDAGITATVNPDGSFTSNGTVTNGAINIWLLGNYIQNYTDKNILMVLAPGKTYRIVDVVLFTGTDYAISPGVFYVDPKKYPDGYKVTGVRHPTLDSGTVLTNQVYHPRVILGGTDTGWEPYRGHTATITSDRPLTKWDKLTCRDGVWGWAYGGTKYICSLNEVISQHGASIGKKYPCMTFSMKGKARDAGEVCACNYLKSVGSEALNGNAIGIWGHTNPTYKNYVYIGIPYSVLGTTIDSTADENTAAMTAWINAKKEAGAPVTIEYKLAEEEWVPLTAKEQATMNALCTYAGTTHIWTDDPLQPVISLDYTVDTEGYIRETAPAYRDVERFALTGEAFGTVATCTDSAEWPLLGVGMKGKCEQLTTTGKNLFGGRALADKIMEVAPDSIIDEDKGTITFASNIISGKTLYDNFEAGKRYTIILCGKNTDQSYTATNLRLTYDDGINVSLSFQTANTYSYCVYSSTVDKTVVSMSGIWITSKTELQYDKCGIFEGAIDIASFEPYTGTAPSPSPAYKQEIQETGTYNPETGMYEADMVMTGAQLFDQTTVTKQSYVNDVTGKIGSTAEDVNASDYISVMGYEYIKITSTMKTKQWGAFYDTNKTFLSGIVGYDKPIPVPPDASYARLTVIGDNLKTFMVNAGATALPWEPYKGVQTLTLTAGQPWRGIGNVHDEVCDRDGVLGTWRRYAGEILDGSEDEAWRTTGCSEASHKRFYSNLVKTKAKPAGSNAKVEPVLCTAYKAMTANDTYLQKQGISVEIDGTIAVYDDGFSPDADVNGFKARLAEYPITVVYQLKEPYFEPFPDEIQKQYRKLKSYAGATHAWVDDPLQPEVSFRYVKDSKLILGKLEDRLTALEAGQAQTAAAFSYLPPEIQAEMIETETRELMNSI